MIPVVITHYGIGERDFTTEMPQVPAIGDSVHLGDENIPIGRVFHVRWCATVDLDASDDVPGLIYKWHAEVGIR
jgi:hypothetical protein